MKQTISELTDNERAWNAQQLDFAVKFVNAYSPSDSGQPMTLAALDRAFKTWMASQESDVEMINAIINAVGIQFGKFLTELRLRWVIATDEDGSDLALYGLPGTADVLVYPANFVAKRWERRETDFLEKSYREIAKTIASMQRNVPRVIRD